MTPYQHKQHLMAMIASSLLPNRLGRSGTPLATRAGIYVDDLKDLAEDCERIVNAIIDKSEVIKTSNNEHNDY